MNCQGTGHEGTTNTPTKNYENHQITKTKESWDETHYKWHNVYKKRLQEHVLAEEEQMDAAQTKQRLEEKTYRDKNGKKEGSVCFP